MYNAINRLIIALAIIAMLTACGNKEGEAAARLYGEAEAQIDLKNYSEAITLLDTLNTRYANHTQIRKDALRLRARAMEGIALDSIAVGSEALAQATLRREELQPKFRHVDSSVGLEGYFLPIGVDEKVMTNTCFQARVSDKGFLYIVVNIEGRPIGFKSLTFVDGNEQITTEELSPARIIKVENSESASFNPEDIEGIGQWLSCHPNTSKVIFNGTKGKATAKIDKKQLQQTILCYDFAQALQAQRLASLKREKYERMLETARNQLANLPIPSQATK